eukprot:6182786-Pleurochrysis_carterae.AAC.1
MKSCSELERKKSPSRTSAHSCDRTRARVTVAQQAERARKSHARAPEPCVRADALAAACAIATAPRVAAFVRAGERESERGADAGRRGTATTWKMMCHGPDSAGQAPRAAHVSVAPLSATR